MTFKPARLLLALIAVSAAPAFAQNLAVVNGKAIPTSRVEEAVKQLVAAPAPDAGNPEVVPVVRAQAQDGGVRRRALRRRDLRILGSMLRTLKQLVLG